MNMSPNLIPVHRQLRNARSERLRAWGWACGVTMCIVTVWWLGCGTGSSRAAAPPPEAFTKTSAEISQANEESARLRRQLAELKEQVVARQSVSQRADASVLLAVLAQATGEDIVVERCELAGRDPKAEGSAQILRLNGAARNQPAVASFLLALEGTGLFKNVSLVRSGQQQLNNTQIASFQVECVIGQGQGGVR
jgi:Tfp pilus assembly protein PilN